MKAITNKMADLICESNQFDDELMEMVYQVANDLENL
jgi:hypothetical protein